MDSYAEETIEDDTLWLALMIRDFEITFLFYRSLDLVNTPFLVLFGAYLLATEGDLVGDAEEIQSVMEDIWLFRELALRDLSIRALVVPFVVTFDLTAFRGTFRRCLLLVLVD